MRKPRLAGLVGGMRLLTKWPVLPVATIILLAIAAIFAPLIAPHGPLDSDLEKRKAPPAWVSGGSSSYLLGGDSIGRDILSRIIYGTRVSLMVAGAVLAGGALLGMAIGVLSGYAGGAVDELLMRLVDFFFAVPFIMIALVAAVVFGASLPLLIILLIVFSWPPFARQVRAETLQLKAMDYVALARVAGASPLRISYRHIAPGVVNTVMVLISLRVGGLILTEAILSYLGVGIPAPTPAWGSMVSDGRDYVATAWWISLFPGMAIFLTVFAFNFLGDWLRDWLDPRLRQL